MAVPSELQTYASEANVVEFARVLECIRRDLAKAKASLGSVELLRKEDQRDGLRKFFALEKSSDADRWLAVNATVLERDVRILAPFRGGHSFPYSVEITLHAPLSVICSFRKGLILKAEWVVEPDTVANRPKAKQLEALKLPDVGWLHDSAGVPVVLAEGSRLGVSAGTGQRRVTWTVFSAYQGFLINVGPRIVKYVQAAPRLEALLSHWMVEGANAPTPVVPARRPAAPKEAAPEPKPQPAPQEIAPEPEKPSDPLREDLSHIFDEGSEPPKQGS